LWRDPRPEGCKKLVGFNNGDFMPRLILSSERIIRARALIQQARDLPVPAVTGRYDFTYITQVKALFQQARDLVKFIPDTPSATIEIKNEVSKIFQEIDQAKKELFH
jgi:hypothetical protein